MSIGAFRAKLVVPHRITSSGPSAAFSRMRRTPSVVAVEVEVEVRVFVTRGGEPSRKDAGADKRRGTVQRFSNQR